MYRQPYKRSMAETYDYTNRMIEIEIAVAKGILRQIEKHVKKDEYIQDILNNRNGFLNRNAYSGEWLCLCTKLKGEFNAKAWIDPDDDINLLWQRAMQRVAHFLHGKTFTVS